LRRAGRLAAETIVAKLPTIENVTMVEKINGVDPDIIALFKKAIWEADQKKLDGLKPEDPITSLGIDSVAMMEAIGYIEDELQIHLSDESLATVQTVSDLARIIGSAKNATSAKKQLDGGPERA
jgi:acyl carrier protein